MLHCVPTECTAVKRIMQEARELANDPCTDYSAAPLEVSLPHLLHTLELTRVSVIQDDIFVSAQPIAVCVSFPTRASCGPRNGIAHCAVRLARSSRVGSTTSASYCLQSIHSAHRQSWCSRRMVGLS